MPAYTSREALDAVLARLAGLVEKDPAFIKGSRGKTHAIRIFITDYKSPFHIYFRDGTVVAGLGEPDGAAQIDVKLNSEAFDGVFGGTANPARAAMKGDLVFSGNMTLALKFQAMLPDFIRLYKQAKAAPR